MSKRHDYDLIVALDGDNVIGEAAENESFGSPGAGGARHGSQWKQVFLNEFDSVLEGIGEFRAKAPPFGLVPRRCSLGFLGGLPKDTDIRH